jgi:outer membrane protein
MKRQIAAMCLAGLAISAPALADLRIGYVDMRQVLTEAKSIKQFRADMEKSIKDKQASFKKEEEKLQALGQAMEKEALTLSDAQKQQKQKEFQEKVQAYQKQRQDAEQELRQKDMDFSNKSLEQIRNVIDQLAKDEKLNLILSRNEVLFSDTGEDLTPKVLAKLDAGAGKGGDKAKSSKK